MVEELSNYLKACDIEVVAAEDFTVPATKVDKHSILVLPSFNILEMIEEAVDEEGSLSDYVHNQLEEVHRLSVEEVFQRIVKSRLLYTDLSSELKNLDGKNFEEIYRAYSLIWEGQELLDEQLSETETESFLISDKWVQDRLEDDALIVLELPQTSGYEAPLWVPMGGYNECPLPVYQSVIVKHWQEVYGIKILAVTEDTWIFQAGSRPQTYQEALKLAQEHFIFCQYVLDEFPSLGHYANYLMKQEVWHFWWD
ncbi:DUF4253 domain-containing protein [Brevibacillus antibioticus]|uniref:DUF4253 domain-containing protein n=1 Tax=Brevibacillus antibioticus TaxID=2570228 RepID=A0A4U2YBN0_9BACL|nr:DUF4253 domain-containing protein [Brevibacillus antibioticus]TKI56771.1 DUF4253 domain-containing protein [Brevibacillus antibioticus]